MRNRFHTQISMDIYLSMTIHSITVSIKTTQIFNGQHTHELMIISISTRATNLTQILQAILLCFGALTFILVAHINF